jgi:polysaccharide biosynthesis transport protein
MVERPDTPAQILGRYGETLRLRWPLVVAMVATATVVALCVTALLPRSYEATAKVLLDGQRQVDALLGTSAYAPDPERELNTSVQLITIEPILDDVRRSLGLSEPVAELAGRIGTGVDRNSNIVSITVEDDQAARAASIANAVASGYRDYRSESAGVGVKDAIAAAQARLDGVADGPDRAALEAELRRLQVAEAFQTGGVQVVHRATAGAASRRPRLLAGALAGGLLGAMLAALAIVVLTRTDDRVRNERDLERLAGRPVTVRVPASTAAASDVLATLAVSVARGRDGDPPPAAVLLTSPGPGEGVAEVALGVARGLGALGRRTIVIDANLREPCLPCRLKPGSLGGLVAVLEGASDVEGELTDIGEGVAVLPTERAARLPQALLAGQQMSAAVAEAGRLADVVLVVGAPAGVVGDSLLFADLTDAVMLVTRLGTTRKTELERAVRALEGEGVGQIIVIATTAPPSTGELRRIAARLRQRRSAADTGRLATPGLAAGPGTASEATSG